MKRTILVSALAVLMSPAFGGSPRMNLSLSVNSQGSITKGKTSGKANLNTNKNIIAAIRHGNSGDGNGIIAYQGKQEETFKGSEKKIALKKLKNKIKTEFTLGFSPEFEASRTKYFTTNILDDLAFKSKDNMTQLYQALKSGKPVREALNLYTLDQAKSFWNHFSKRNESNDYDLNDMESAFSGSNLKVNLKLEVNPDLSETCPECKQEDFVPIPQEGVELKIKCALNGSDTYGVYSEYNDNIDIDHNPIIILPSTKKIERTITIGSPEIADYYRLKSCDHLKDYTFTAPTCYLTYNIEDDNIFKPDYESYFTKDQGFSIVQQSSQATSEFLPRISQNSNTPITTEEYLSQNSGCEVQKEYTDSYDSLYFNFTSIKHKSFNKYGLRCGINKEIQYHNEKELDQFIKGVLIKTYEKFVNEKQNDRDERNQDENNNNKQSDK